MYLCEAGPQHGHGAELAEQRHQQPEQPDEETELHPGVLGDLLGQAEAHLHRVFKGPFRLKEVTITSCFQRIIRAQSHLDPGGQPLHGAQQHLALAGLADLVESISQTVQMTLGHSVLLERGAWNKDEQ